MSRGKGTMVARKSNNLLQRCARGHRIPEKNNKTRAERLIFYNQNINPALKTWYFFNPKVNRII
jgi:hypothetical protein